MNRFFEVHRNYPINILEADKTLFSHEIIRRIPEPEMIFLSNFIIDGNGVFIACKSLSIKVTEKNQVYSISWIKLILLSLKKLIKFRISLLFKIKIWFTDGWSYGYFHWILDALPRLFSLLERNTNLGKIVYLPAYYENIDFIAPSLEAFGIGDVRYLKPKKYYIFRKVVFQTHLAPTGNYHEETIRKMKSKLLKSIVSADHCGAHDRIYISRKKASRRRIINEEELVPVLKKYKFKIVCFEDYSWEEQVMMCSKSNTIIGLHGAGLTNMLFMPEGSSVLELRKRDDSHNNCYFSLASALNHDYYYQLCEADQEDILEADFSVDPVLLGSNIEQIFAGISKNVSVTN